MLSFSQVKARRPGKELEEQFPSVKGAAKNASVFSPAGHSQLPTGERIGFSFINEECSKENFDKCLCFQNVSKN